MFYPELSPMSMKWHVLQNNSSRILNCSSAAAAISNLELFGGNHGHNHHQQQHYNGFQIHSHQRYASHGNASTFGSGKHFDQFGKSHSSTTITHCK